MQLIGVFSPSHERLKDQWFLPTLKDDYDVRLSRCDVQGQGSYMQDDWTRAIVFKSATIVEAIRENWGNVFVYSDVDVTFFAPTKAAILNSLTDKDIVCQLDDPAGNLCTGFFASRANPATLELWEEVRKAVERERRDQWVFNRLARAMKQLRVGYLPSSFFGAGTFSARVFQGTERFYIPPDPVMFHANFTVGVDDKLARLAEAQRIVAQGEWRRRLNSVLCQLQSRARPSRAGALTGQGGTTADQSAHRDVIDHTDYIRPRSVALDTSTACQLKCPSCPTATGAIAKSIGAGFLTVANFEKFLREHPWVSDVELSNWGEVFLNPDLEEILRLGRERRVTLRIDNGANLDRASDRVLEALVKYKLSSLSCSIDGASQQVYATYRVRGDFDRVIAHVKRIVALKKQYRSRFPLLRWQFVAFGHNQHEIPKAREMARDLGMEFHVKLSWDDLYTQAFSPVSDRKSIEKETGLGVADRQEYEKTFGRSYIASTCHQLWLRPRINYDGRLLGCSINYWDDFGNVFADGMEASLHGERMRSTKEALMGYREMDEASPCRRCQVYHSMRRNGAWVRPEDLTPATSDNGLTRWVSAPARAARRCARLFTRAATSTARRSP